MLPRLVPSGLLLCTLLTACGGGGSSGSLSTGDSDLATRTTAALATATDNPLCQAIRPFYWEIGDASGVLASGSVGTRSNGSPWRATDTMSIASASKWLYAAYVVQLRSGAPSASADIPFLNFTSGYSNFGLFQCPADGTVAECHDGSQNAAEAAAGTFHYNADHFQTHAVANGLGGMDRIALAAEIRRLIGPELALSYIEPQLAGSGQMTPADYGAFLRKMLGSNPALRLGTLLGSNATCTKPGAGCDAHAPAVVPEAWHYSLGHWVEDDASTTPSTNFAYSSAGAFGFYPWIDTSRTRYGILAREDVSATGEGYDSGRCGRLIRQAWSTGQAQ